MSSRILFGGVLLAAAVACTDSVTNPSLITAGSSAPFLIGDPPPPPMDSSMAAFDDAATYVVRVTYFFSKTGNNAWLSFDKNQAAGVTASPNARITVSQGRATARGTLSIATSSATWTTDLAKAISPGALERFGACKYTCASLTLDGTLVYKGGETDDRSLSFQFTSPATEIAIIGDVR